MARLRALPGEAGERTRQFLVMREHRLLEGLDPGVPCLRECPSLLWQALRSAALFATTPQAASDETDPAALAVLRASIPTEKHAELDAAIAEARALTGLREERGLSTDVWAWGILRTTVLAIGRRLIRRSPVLLCDAADLVYATADEVRSLLAQSVGPSAIELETRAAFARAYTTSDAPPTLGPKAGPPPSLGHLPAGLQRIMACALRLVPLMLAPPPEKSSDPGLRGVAASSGVWEGPVHIVTSHDDAKDIPVGAVLVVGGGSAAFTMMAPLASAVVSEGGGLLSHVAIVCREYRIPCVCGVADVLASLENGQRIRVDGTRGVVEVIAG
jgi:pyruvate,water dikinase